MAEERVRRRAWSKTSRLKLRADPERLARHREQHRVQEARRRRANPRPPTIERRAAARAATRPGRARLAKDPPKLRAVVERRRERDLPRYAQHRATLPS